MKRRPFKRCAISAATAILALAVHSVALADVHRIKTRYGTLTMETLSNRVNFEGRVFFRGRPLHPDVRGNNALYVHQTFRLAQADAVLFEDVGAEACPSLWYIVTVSPSGAASTREFGSCGDLIDTRQRGQSIIVRTRGFLGPFEPAAARQRASTQTHMFLYRGGVVTENGKPVP